MYRENVKSIVNWTMPRCTFDVWSFHGFTSFYWKFIINFSGICEPLIECMKKGDFQWITLASKFFETLNKVTK
jgi:hypothetical protein